MFVLDTNVISELMSDNPRPTVLAWVDEQRASDLFVTAITEAEIRTGVAILPEGRRRRGLTEATERTFGKLYAGRVLPFGSEAALAYATIAAARRAAGRPIAEPDCQIAAIAHSYGAAIVTRNVPDFAGTGVAVINPWIGA